MIGVYWLMSPGERRWALLQEHANVMAAVKIGESKGGKSDLPVLWLKKRFGEVNKYTISFRKSSKIQHVNFDQTGTLN